MTNIMKEYVDKISLVSDEVTKGILKSALSELPTIAKYNIISKANKYIVDITLNEFSIEASIEAMNHFMENTRFHYSAYFVRFNEGNLVRYRYASCKEDKSGFYCDVVIS